MLGSDHTERLSFWSHTLILGFYGMISECAAMSCFVSSFFLEIFLNRYLQPFTSDFPWADIHELLSPDLLHQLINGTFKDHLVTWVNEYLVEEYGAVRGLEIIDDIDWWYGISWFSSAFLLNYQLSIIVSLLFQHSQGCDDFQMGMISSNGRGMIQRHLWRSEQPPFPLENCHKTFLLGVSHSNCWPCPIRNGQMFCNIYGLLLSCMP